MPKPIKRFRLYPERRSLYFVVNIWSTRQHMRDAVADLEVEAMCSSEFIIRVYPDGRERLMPHLGRIDFHAGALEPEVVAHELLHAVFRWAERISLEFHLYPEPGNMDAMCPEERLCYAHTSMMRAFLYRTQGLRP